MILKCRINNKEYPIVQGIPISEEFNETLDSASIIVPFTEKIDDLRPYDDVYIYEGEFKGYPLNNGTNEPIIENIPIEFVADNGKGKFAFRCPKLYDNLLELYTTYNKDTDIDESFFKLNIVWEDGTKTVVDYLLKKDTRFYLEKQSRNIIGNDILGLSIAGDYLEGYIDLTPEMPSQIYWENNIKWFPKTVERGFYKHFLVDEMPFELINIEDGIYKYKINLFSETKKLEKIVLPNLTITPPIDKTNAKTVWDYLLIYNDLYSPLVKTVDKVSHLTDKWVYRKKYTISSELKKIFNNVYAPEQSFNTPTYKDLLTSLMLTKDCIPYVEDDVIKALDISERKGNFEITDEQLINISGSRSSENHADNLKRNYSNALSQEHSAKQIKYMGFRNSSTGLMTLGNMRLEFGFPIYSIDKIHMCYFKKMKRVNAENELVSYGEITFLCKQDITPLVILNAKRNILSEDWEKFENVPLSIEDIAKFKLSTIGYDIGSRYISGWGETYTYMKNKWFDGTKSYIENIYSLLNTLYPMGIYEIGYFKKKFNIGENEKVVNIVDSANPLFDLVTHQDLTGASKLKGLFFEVEYKAFYNGATSITKDSARDDITVIDNPSSSLTVLEKDGLFEKEKANRFGNEAITIVARYKDISELQPLGSIYGDDYIIYHREYAIYDTEINCVYYATKNYVLKNYYTSVFSKLKPFALAPYEESITRAENRKLYLLLSKNHKYSNDKDEFYNYEISNRLLLTGLTPSSKPESINSYNFPNKINTGIISYKDNKYLCDVNGFMNGNSMCFNIKPYDNVSMGVYIEKITPNFAEGEAQDTYTGSVQNWYLTADKNGYAEKLGFYVAHSKYLIIKDNASQEEINEIYEKLFALPKADNNVDNLRLTNVIGKEYNINKDNKEIIDITFQIEPIAENDIIISPMFLKLCDLLSNYQKNSETYTLKEIITSSSDMRWVYGAFDYAEGDDGIVDLYPLIALNIDNTRLELLKEQLGERGTVRILGDLIFDKKLPLGAFEGDRITKYAFIADEITEITDEYIVVSGLEEITVKPFLAKSYVSIRRKNYKLKKGQNPAISFPEGDTTNWYFNATFTQENGVYPYYFENEIITENPKGELSLWKEIYTTAVEDTFLSFGSLITGDASIKENIGDLREEIKTYKQNMFVVFSNEEIKNHLIHNEFKSIVASDYKVTDIFDVDTVGKEIYVNLENVEDAKSIQLWFYDEDTKSYKFVFGVNVTEEEKQQKELIIQASIIKSKDERVYGLDNQLTGKVYNGLLETGKLIERS